MIQIHIKQVHTKITQSTNGSDHKALFYIKDEGHEIHNDPYQTYPEH
jgi:hypothetical protein